MRIARPLLIAALCWLLPLSAWGYWQSRGEGINLSVVTGGGGSVTVDATGTETKSGASVASLNYTGITVGASAKCLVATVQFFATGVTGITANWDSTGTPQAMTELQSTNLSFVGISKVYGLRNPTAGNKTLALAWTTNTQVMVAAISFVGCDVTSDATAFPTAGRTGTADITGTTTPNIAVTSAANHIVVAGTMNNGFDYSAATGTSIYIDNGGAVGNAAMQRYAGSGSVTVQWTVSNVADSATITAVDVSP